MTSTLSRRSFLAGTAAFAAGIAALGLPRRAFADDAQAAEGAVVILHTNDVHCAVGETDAAGDIPLGYSALASYVANRRSVFGAENVTLVDAGDAVQGKVMGTITQGQALIDIMNECGYDIAIPGNHEFDYGMTQFNHLIGSANAKYLSCNFTDNRTGAPTLMFDPYTIKEYPLPAGGTVRVAFVGVTTPATLTASSPRSFWRSDDDHTCVYGFCEDETGSKLVQAVQGAVDEARAAGAEFVVLLAHLGQTGQPSQWRSDTLVSRCEGINVVIDGHSHEEYVQIVQDRNGDDVVIAQTGTQCSSVRQIVIIPDTGTIHASTYSYEASLLRETRKPDDPAYVQEVAFGRDAQTQAVVDEKAAEVEAQTGTVVGRSEVDLFAYEADGYTWAVRAHETNLGDFVADAYLYYASNNGVMPDVAFVNGGGVRTNLLAGDVTRRLPAGIRGPDIHHSHRHRLARHPKRKRVRGLQRRRRTPCAARHATRQSHRPGGHLHAGVPFVLPRGRRRVVQHAHEEPRHASGPRQRCADGIRATEPARRHRAGIRRRRRPRPHGHASRPRQGRA